MMPKLIPSKKFLSDLEQLKSNAALLKKVAKCLQYLETNPLHPSLHLERIINDSSAWSVRIDKRYRLSFDPTAHLPAGNPDWAADLILLRLLDHDDLYKKVR
jgi:mRNA-degrading endonuclease RelE of RelBE toxin-antitoxin system